jgi:hypothetical protein
MMMMMMMTKAVTPLTARDRHNGCRVGWLNGFSSITQGFHESRRCSRDTYPESYITKYTSIQR